MIPLGKTILLLLISLILLTPQSLSSKQALTTTMKVHPIPKRRTTATPISLHHHLNPHKKLRRLPHVFSCVLELPLSSDADVTVLDTPDSFRFVIAANETDSLFHHHHVRAHAVEIHPGVTKIVVRESSGGDDDDDEVTLTLDELELDMWRFRLPETTRPELARAVLVDGELAVTVPKIRVENLEGEGFRGDIGNRIVLVQ